MCPTPLPDQVDSPSELAQVATHASPANTPRTTGPGTTAVMAAEPNTLSLAKDFRRLAGFGSSLLFVAALTMAALVAILILF